MIVDINKLIVYIEIIIAVTFIGLNLYYEDNVSFNSYIHFKLKGDKYIIHLLKCKFSRNILTEAMDASSIYKFTKLLTSQLGESDI